MSLASVLGFALALLPLPQAQAAENTEQRMLTADKDPANWLTYYGNYQGWRHSGLKQIDRSNIKNLHVKWTLQTGLDSGFQATPIVVDGVMYIGTSLQNVFAIDAASGNVLWRYKYEFAKDMPSKLWGQPNRGVTVIQGKVLMGTIDAHMIALDAKTGKLLWNTTVGDYTEGQGITHPPIIVKGRAVVGMSTLEFPTRGKITALNVDTGKIEWTFNTIPETSPKELFGGAVWLPVTYDPELNSIYFGVGNPDALFNGEDRPGADLYTSSIISLDADTGTLKWYYQTVPHDVWDYDAMNETLLANVMIGGSNVKALFQANKNGYFYALDRTNGKFLYAKPFVPKITWTDKLDSTTGLPVGTHAPTADGFRMCPSVHGAKNWDHMSFDPDTGLIYIPTINMCNVAVSVRMPNPKKGTLILGGDFDFAGNVKPGGGLIAIDPATGLVKWSHPMEYPLFSSVLSTAGGLVFTGDIVGNFMAFDERDGKQLWSFRTSSGNRGSAISYSVNGTQYIAVPAGSGGISDLLQAAYPELKNVPNGSTLFVFALSN